ncbi:hypothetical protein DFH11DRAFT_683637 [Phellopilus nigrolimitatus]|nr:hypothetical protein DFH11DRAFT_683637 [Phellopilus nigrolimitatus]
MDSDLVSAKFQQTYVATLHSFSPSYAALHASRNRRSASLGLRHAASPLHCSRCGHFGVSTRLIHTPNKRTRTNIRMQKDSKHKTVLPTPDQRVSARGKRMCKTCTACGFVDVQAVRQDDDVLRNVLHAASGSDVQATSTASPARSTSPALTPKERSRTVPVSAFEGLVETNASMQGDVVWSNAEGKARAPGNNVASRRATPAETPSVPQRSAPGSSPAPSAGSLAKRSKKKAGLQEMLARSKEKKAKRAEDEGKGSSGLAAFLSGL